jgi:hypothetical protein
MLTFAMIVAHRYFFYYTPVPGVLLERLCAIACIAFPYVTSKLTDIALRCAWGNYIL